jgi:hypothetical protein
VMPRDFKRALASVSDTRTIPVSDTRMVAHG